MAELALSVLRKAWSQGLANTTTGLNKKRVRFEISDCANRCELAVVFRVVCGRYLTALIVTSGPWSHGMIFARAPLLGEPNVLSLEVGTLLHVWEQRLSRNLVHQLPIGNVDSIFHTSSYMSNHLA